MSKVIQFLSIHASNSVQDMAKNPQHAVLRRL